MAHILDFLKDHVLLSDGGMGSCIHTLDLEIEKDFWGHENCTDILTRSRPDVVAGVHRAYFEAGSDMATTNSFGTSPTTLCEFGLENDAFDLSKESAELAREVANEFSADGRQRFILGGIGPGTKLPSLGHIGYQELEDALTIQAMGLIAGNVDAILIETCQDPLQIKAAVNGAKKARSQAGADTPIFVQVTVETTGTLLTGSDIASAATVVQALDVQLMGLNCATGPQEMAGHIKWLSESWPGLISVQPNAGLPELVDGDTCYPLDGKELANWLERFVQEDGVNITGGCCGADTRHISTIDAMLRRIAPKGRHRPAPVRRTPHWEPSVASLFGQAPYRQENAFFSIGERCNANGSKKFRELLDAQDWDGCVAMARSQVKEGSTAIDVCTAFVGRDEVADMTEVVSRMRSSVTAPLVFDSTELPVLEAALKLYSGKPVINSISLEDGEEPASARLELARKFGAGVIALTIDENGMAKKASHKLAIAKRLYDLAVKKHGLAPSDLLFDPLTFTICTGNEDDRKLAIETLKAVEHISKELPECQVILGLSNVSFGLKPAARHVLNSVFLDHALGHGMNGAIVHLGRIRPLYKIPAEKAKASEDLIYDRRTKTYDPLHAFIELFAIHTKDEDENEAKQAPATVEERLKQRIVDGDRNGLSHDLDEALKIHSPLKIVNDILLDGMKVVGKLFGSGKMQLPFVLQSAETMKVAVTYLESHMEKVQGQAKGTLVLATVKGDVHDIGKNLVDIILTNNGYKVVNIGIKKPVQDIIDAVKAEKADAVGMSGLLVKSTVIMRENLEEMSRQGLHMPVLLGGAALTRKYVEEDCAQAYGSGQVLYANDAFDGLSLMGEVVSGNFGSRAPKAKKTVKARKTLVAEPRPIDWDEVKLRRADLHAGQEVPAPPFWGARVIESIDPKALWPFLNQTMLFRFHWGFKKAAAGGEDWRDWIDREVRPILKRIMGICQAENILTPRAAYGYWKCASQDNQVVLFGEDGATEVARFLFPRQARESGLCIADFFRDVDSGKRDVIALQAVTTGQRVADVAQEWLKKDRYQDYLYLHGLGVEMAEALAEYVHKRIRGELGFSHHDARDLDKVLKQGYQGARYSFGYPACPDMAGQHNLLKLLGAERIGLVMDEHDQLHPEQSTAAIVAHHPQAKYFTV